MSAPANLPPDLSAMQAVLALREPVRRAAVNWLVDRINWESRCAKAVERGMRELGK